MTAVTLVGYVLVIGGGLIGLVGVFVCVGATKLRRARCWDFNAEYALEPARLADMPAHPEKPGPYDDYTDERFRALTGPLAAEHYRPRRFADYEQEAL